MCTSAAVSERGGRRTFRPARGLGSDSWSRWMEEEVGSSSMLARRGEEQGVGEEDMVDTVDTNTASVFGRASLKTQLIDINFE